jgi:hypothetical protein
MPCLSASSTIDPCQPSAQWIGSSTRHCAAPPHGRLAACREKPQRNPTNITGTEQLLAPPGDNHILVFLQTFHPEKHGSTVMLFRYAMDVSTELTVNGRLRSHHFTRSEWFLTWPRKVPDNQADHWQEKHHQRPNQFLKAVCRALQNHYNCINICDQDYEAANTSEIHSLLQLLIVQTLILTLNPLSIAIKCKKSAKVCLIYRHLVSFQGTSEQVMKNTGIPQ